LGSHATPARISPRRRLTLAAAPAALASVAAAFAAPAASAAVLPPPQTAAQPPVQEMVHPVAAAASQEVTVAAVVRDLAAAEPKGKHHRALPAKYTVKSGDTLSSIAQRVYHSSKYWPVLYWANHAKIGDADTIQAGQVLTLPAKPARIPKAPALDPASATVQATAATSSGTTASVTTQSAQSTQTATTYSGGSAFQQCVIQRESGGNPNAWNGSYYGLYQFSASTWAEYGGNPADFGHASVAEQNQVFANAMAAGGESNWAPYDGC
jgi:LysM repeat protein